MSKAECRICRYTYDPKRGDSKKDIKPGTEFEDLPAGWVCPICESKKDLFDKLDRT